MANGINFCAGCEHAKAFEHTSTEPAFLQVQNTGLARSLFGMIGLKGNVVAFLDEDQIKRSSMRVPDVAIDDAGSIKLAINDCTGSIGIGRLCGAEAILRSRYLSAANETGRTEEQA